MIRKLAAGVALALVAGCSEGGGSESAPADSSPQSLADKIGCTGFKAEDSPEMFAAESATCDRNGTTVTIETFAQDSAQKNWLAVAKQGGGAYVVGERWIVWTDARPPAEDIQKILGGHLE